MKQLLKSLGLIKIIILLLLLPLSAQSRLSENSRGSFQLPGGNNSGGYQTEAIHNINLNGLSAGENFGYSVASTGDINGDGYSDMIIGAPEYGTDQGRIFVFLGGAVPDNHFDIKINGASGTNAAFSVSSMGDFNGDGYDDFMSAAPTTTTGNGRVWGYYGSENPEGNYDINFENINSAEQFGKSIACAGDVNGDGYDDIIIGAPVNGAGRAYIFYGGAVPNDVVDVTLTGQTSADFFGWSVSTAGDVNGDGFDDVIVGAYQNDGGATNGGRAYIYYGGASMNNTADITITGYIADDYLGSSVSSAGDINQDGYSDVIVGVYGHDNTGTNEGAAYIYFGEAYMNNIADVQLYGFADNDYCGIAVSGAGDVNGDGYDDVVIGAHYNDAGGSNAGSAYIYFGGTDMSSIPNKILKGEAADDNFGFAVAKAGDVNGDGYDDVLIGAYKNDINGSNCGRAYLYINSLTGLDIPDISFNGNLVDGYLGFSVSNAGDVNGDGFEDLIAGEPGIYSSTSLTGKAYIYFGGAGMDNVADVILQGSAVGDEFGYSVSTAGDVNGDGYDDVIVGAPYNDAGGSSAGRAYIFFGGSTMNAIADLVLTGVAAGDKFGYSVSNVGDVNGDGFYDVIVGAPYFTNSFLHAGSAYIYFGGATLNSTADLTIAGNYDDLFLGEAVAKAGDVNGDGYDDVIVGAKGYDNYSSNKQGFAEIYFGGSNIDDDADIWLMPLSNVFKFGGLVSSAGDLNGDGYSDVVVRDNGTYGAGRANIFFGGPNFIIDNDSIPDIVIEDGLATCNFTFSSADINNDGFDDLIVGGFSVRIFFGGSNMDNLPDLITLNEAEDIYSVSGIRDINQDGYDDVFVGDPHYSEGGNYAGKAFLFLSTSPPVKPRLISVNDVAYDQGGYVNLNFRRSANDSREVHTISQYQIHRSVPPGQSGFSWSLVGTIVPSQDERYTYLSVTPNDSMSNNSGTYFYRITAVNSTGELWKSNILSGQSVDNLVPSAVVMFRGSFGSSKVTLNWRENREQDLFGYYIYRSPLASINPDEVEPLAVVNDTLYVDNNPPSGSLFYFIRAKDIHGNFSPLTGASNNPLPVELSLFTASAKGNNVELKWRTITEINLANFTIERKTEDRDEWINKGEVAASGNSNSTKDYSFTDGSLSPGKYLYRLKITDNDGYFDYSDVIEAEVALPDEYVLYQNYPNPFNPVTTIRYSIPGNGKKETENVSLKIFDVLGNEVAVLVNEAQAPGEYNINFNAALLSSGIYYYRLTIHSDKLTAGEFSETKKMLLIK